MKEFSLGDILDGLREKFSKGSSGKEKVRLVISKVLEEEVPASALSVRGRTLFVSLPPVVKNELYLKKAPTLEALSNEGFFFDDIR